MKLRATSSSQQLIFPAIAGLLVLSGIACAQAPAGPQAYIKVKNGQPQQGVIQSVTTAGVSLTLAAGGAVTLPLANIESVQMPPPPEYGLAMQAVAQKDIPKALGLITGVASKYKRLPTDWAQQATALTGYLALQTGELVKAEVAFDDFKKCYPTSSDGDVGSAAIAAAKKNFAVAREKIAPIIEEALKVKDVPIPLRYAYSRAFYVSGQVKEADGNSSGALEDYLRTVTIFYHDSAAVAAAQERADALRKTKVTVP